MTTAIAYCCIYPGIGVARVGNSPDDYFIGPERPGHPDLPGGGFKDRNGLVKRQAARFRVFGFDARGEPVRELTAAEADIRWTVHLVNRKAAAPAFARPDGSRAAQRNPDVPAARRDGLVIDPGPRGISGPGAGGDDYRFDSGCFQGVPVDLGELRTDEAGRLLVLGGCGRSGSPGDKPLDHFADNDGWFDDTSDGPVTAEVTLRSSGERLEVRRSSWVVVAPPDFAPWVTNLVTLYDVAEQAAVDAGFLPMPTGVCYRRDILPVFERAVGYQWVNGSAWRGHHATRRAGSGSVERRGDFTDSDHARLLADPGDSAAEARRRVFERIREPLTDPDDPDELRRAERQATNAYMPPLSGSGGTAKIGKPETWLTVTPVQYERLRMWAAGKFHTDDHGTCLEEPPAVQVGLAGGDATTPPRPGTAADATAGSGGAGDGVAPVPGHGTAAGTAAVRGRGAGSGAAAGSDVGPTPAELDRAALESCTGGPFYPGIEISSRAADPGSYVAPFRLRPDLEPGGMTERMAVPWQADFADCQHFWWPAQRPDDVIVKDDFTAIAHGLYPRSSARSSGDRRPISTTAFPRHRWDRGIGDRTTTALELEGTVVSRHREMVDEWSRLGFVVPERAQDGSEVLVETERHPYVGLRDRDYFHIMLNLDRYPDFLPTARKLAAQFLRTARRAQRDPNVDSDLLPFRYSELAFDARMDSIYSDLVDEAAAYDPDRDAVFRTRADVIERLRQFGPLNQTDGLWLRNVATIGPIDDLTGYLTRIWIDEVGGGDPAQNHSNIFTELLAGVGIATAPVASVDFAQDERLLDSAFTLPLLQLVVSQFTDQYFPELLGMTLFFEWESVGLATSVRMLDRHGIADSYYALHVAIDNAEAGHGALAKQAVKRYLAGFRDEAERQRHWARVWDGYVAFRVSGTLAEDLRARLHAGHRARVLELVERKAQYGSLNHGPAAAAAGITNDLFDRPEQMLEVLVRSGQVVPGHPERSPLMKHMDFGGRMYRVFTPEEIGVWNDWISSLAPSGAEAGSERTAEAASAAAPAGTASPPGAATSGAATSGASRNGAATGGAIPTAAPGDGATRGRASAGGAATGGAPVGRHPAQDGGVPRLHLSSPAEAFEAHPRKTVLGYGCVH